MQVSARPIRAKFLHELGDRRQSAVRHRKLSKLGRIIGVSKPADQTRKDDLSTGSGNNRFVISGIFLDALYHRLRPRTRALTRPTCYLVARILPGFLDWLIFVRADPLIYVGFTYYVCITIKGWLTLQ